MGDIIINPNIVIASDYEKDSDKEKEILILKAKNIVRQMVRHNPTLRFYDWYTKVNKNIVTLQFNFINAFGESETHVIPIKVNHKQ